MAGFGAAEFVHSKFLNKNVLKCKSSIHDGKFYLFKHQKSSDTKFGEKSYYICLGCWKISRKGTLSRVSVLWVDKMKNLGTVDVWNIPECYRITHRSKEMSENPERWFLDANQHLGILIFASDSDLLVLANSSVWFADGTFNICPKEFQQLYMIHVEHKGEPMPLVYCFLKGKTEATYLEVFQIISRNLTRVLPPGMAIRASDIMMDFETAERKAFAQVFPQINVRGCTFHYGQAIIRKIGLIGLKEQYSDQGSLVRVWIRHLLSLPFLPPFLVIDAWNLYLNDPRRIQNQAGFAYPFPDQHSWQLMLEFGRYFMKTWLGRVGEWNHFSNYSHRTNNIPEAQHSKMKRKFGHVHSSMHHVLHFLQETQFEYYCRQVKLDGGHPPKPKSVVYANLHQSVLSYRAQFAQRFAQLQMNYYMRPLMYRNFFIQEVKHFLGAMSYLLCQEKKY